MGETEQDARERLRSFIPNLQAWHKSFVDSSGGGGGGGGDGGGNGPGNAEAAPALQRSVSFGKQQNVPIAIPKILEIEESISSPVYGIKGAYRAMCYACCKESKRTHTIHTIHTIQASRLSTRQD